MNQKYEEGKWYESSYKNFFKCSKDSDYPNFKYSESVYNGKWKIDSDEFKGIRLI